HGIHPNFLHTSPGLSSLAVLHAPCAVARHTSGNAPNATHTDPTTAQASQSPYTLCRPPPPTALYRRRTGDRFPSQAPWCPAASDHLHTRTPAHRRPPGAVLSGPGLFLCRLDGTGQHPFPWASRREAVATAPVCVVPRVFPGDLRDNLSWQTRRARPAGVGSGGAGGRHRHP